jgi:hypothetical protein
VRLRIFDIKAHYIAFYPVIYTILPYRQIGCNRIAKFGQPQGDQVQGEAEAAPKSG